MDYFAILLPYSLPVIFYAKCVFPGKPPVEYIGEWPKRRKVYQVEVRLCRHCGEVRVFVQGLWANHPHCGFKLHRFQRIAMEWLN